MSAQDRISTRGAAAIAHLDDLGTVEARAVMYLRLWWDGGEAREAVHADFRLGLGDTSGASAVRALDQFCTLCSRFGRRPLMRHALTCRCVGADEACLAHVIGAAAEAQREDALMMAMTLVRGDVAPGIVALSEQLGLALRRLAPTTTPRPGAGRIH